ncbi:energy-coupling factor transporter transmembrane component T family protein [Tessaracoccus sp. G1721]
MMLQRLDVRVKILAFVAVMVGMFVFSDPLATACLLVLVLAAVTATRTPVRGLWTMLQPLLPVLVLIVAVTMVTSTQFTRPGLHAEVFSVWGLSATLGGLLVGLNFVARILLMVVATYAFTISTPVDDLLEVLSRAHAPSWLSILVTTSISFVPTMARKKDMIVEAQRARGARVADSGPLGRLVSLVPIMVPLITNSILMAENLAVAMTNRGFGANSAMTGMRVLRLRPVDLVVTAVVLGVLCGILVLRFGYGSGVL